MAGAQLREVQVRPGPGMAGRRHPHDNGRNLLSFFCLLSLILASSSAWQLGVRRPGEEGPLCQELSAGIKSPWAALGHRGGRVLEVEDPSRPGVGQAPAHGWG